MDLHQLDKMIRICIKQYGEKDELVLFYKAERIKLVERIEFKVRKILN